MGEEQILFKGKVKKKDAVSGDFQLDAKNFSTKR